MVEASENTQDGRGIKEHSRCEQALTMDVIIEGIRAVNKTTKTLLDASVSLPTYPCFHQSLQAGSILPLVLGAKQTSVK